MEEKKSEVVTIRLTPAVKKKLENAAKKGFRTLSQEVEMRIIQSIEKER